TTAAEGPGRATEAQALTGERDSRQDGTSPRTPHGFDLRYFEAKNVLFKTPDHLRPIGYRKFGRWQGLCRPGSGSASLPTVTESWSGQYVYRSPSRGRVQGWCETRHRTASDSA